MPKEIELIVEPIEREMTPEHEAALRALVRSWYSRYLKELQQNKK